MKKEKAFNHEDKEESLIAVLNRVEQKIDLQNILLKNVYDIKRAASYCNIAVTTLHKLKDNKKIKYSQPNGKGTMCFFKREDLDSYMLSNPIETSEDITNKIAESERRAADYVNLNPAKYMRGKK